MPLIILAALVVIVLMLYIALGGKEGAPTISLNKIFDFIMPKTPADENAENASDVEVKTTENAAPSEPSEPEREKPAASETSAEAAPEEERPKAADETFSSMEELTEFYRKEAERLTGIKH